MTTPVLESVHFQNFKSLRDVSLEGLQRLTVIVGPTGVGKTSVLQSMRLPKVGQLAARFITRGHEEANVRYGQGHLDLRFTLRSGHYQMDLWDGDQHVVQPPPHPFLLHLVHSRLIEFRAKHLGAPSPASAQPQIAADGSGLATLLAYFAGAERDTLSSIEAELREIIGITGRVRTFPDELDVEEVENIRIDEQLLPRTTRRKTAAHRFELEIDDLGSIPGDLLSEGTLVTLGLLALLHQGDCASLLLIDDIDVGLHPDAQAKLIAALRRLLDQRPELQILCTSHSPYLLDHFEPSEVQVLSFEGGKVSAARLDRHPDWPRWQGKLQTGEFWQSVGESWVGAAHHDETSSNAE